MMMDDLPLNILEDNSTRNQPVFVENFILLPGETILLQTSNVVHLSLIDNSHKIGTLYQTNYQFFFIEDTKKEVTLSVPNGLVMKIKKLKGHVIVKYKEGVLEELSENIASSSSSANNNNNEQATSHSNKKEKDSKIPRSTSNSSNISSASDSTWYMNGVSEKALILEIRCKDFNIVRLCLPTSERGIEAHQNLLKLSFPTDQSTTNNNNIITGSSSTSTTFFAHTYSPFKNTLSFNGWAIYDPIEEYNRQGLLTTGSEWRLTKINMKYEICNTYPQYLIIPCTISDYLIQKSSQFRSKNRFPVCTWRHRYTHASLSRCSQPLMNNGLGKHQRCEEDELLIQAIRKSTPASAPIIVPQAANQTPVPQPPAQLSVPPGVNGTPHHHHNHNQIQSLQQNQPQQPLYIFDVRPKSTATSTFSVGTYTEDMVNYPNCQLEFGGLSNIHELRECSTKLFKVVRNWDDKKSWADVNSTCWLNQIAKLLQASRRILHILHVEGLSVIIRCTDGWDRTPQLTSIVQILADPYYRTMKGFITLICKEWISFGHKFMTRNGNVTSQSNKQTSPVFLQFIDCVWQLTRQFPTSFEFTDQFLVTILRHLNSNLFGTFLYDSDKERILQKIPSETVSLWTFLQGCIKEGIFRNPLYVETTDNEPTTGSNGEFAIKKNYDNANVLFPNVQGVQLWTDYYLKWREPPKPSRKSMTLVDRALGVHGFNGDLLVVHKKKKGSRRSSHHHHRRSSSKSLLSNSDSFSKQQQKDKEKEKDKDKSSSRSSKHKSKKSSSSSSNNNNDTNNISNTEECASTPTTTTTTTTTSNGIEIPRISFDNLHDSVIVEPDLPPIITTTTTTTTTSSEPLAVPNPAEDASSSSPTSPLSDHADAIAANPPSTITSPVSPTSPHQNIDGNDTSLPSPMKRRHSVSGSSPVKSNPLIDCFKETMSPRVDIIQTKQQNNNEQQHNSDNNNSDNQQQQQQETIKSPKSERDRELLKEQRRAKKEQREKEKAEKKARKEKKRQEKKEKEEKMTPDITVVLHTNSKSKPISLTLPARGPKSSRISIFSTATPPSPNTMNAIHNNNATSPTNSTVTSPNLTPESANTAQTSIENNNNNSIAGGGGGGHPAPQHTSSLSKLFKNFSMRGQKTQ